MSSYYFYWCGLWLRFIIGRNVKFQWEGNKSTDIIFFSNSNSWNLHILSKNPLEMVGSC